MATYTLDSKIITQSAVTEHLRCPCQEDLIVNLTLLASAGVAHNGTGGRVEFVFGRPGTRQELKAWVAGASTGIYTLTIPGDATATLDSSYDYSIIYRPASGAVSVLYRGTLTILDYATGPLDLTPSAAVTENTSPAVQSVEIAAILDLPGTTRELTVGPEVRALRGVPLHFRVTCAQLQSTGGTPAPSATGQVVLSHNGTIVGDAATLTQTSAGVFEGAISPITQVALGIVSSDFSGDYVVTITPSDTPYAVNLRTPVEFLASGIPMGAPELTLNAFAATVYRGALAISGTFDDPAGTPVFSVAVNGTTVTPTPAFVLTDNTWGTSVNLTALGSAVIRVTAVGTQGTSSTSRSTTVVNQVPSVTITALAALVAPGSVAIGGDYVDVDGSIIGASFAISVDGTPLSPQPSVTATGGNWSTSISLLSAGSHTVLVTLTDADGGINTASTSTVVQTLTIATPTTGSTVDEVPIAATFSTSPAVSGSTAVQLYVDGVSSGSPGTVGGGATTAQLVAGSRSLTARMTVSGVTVNSTVCSLTVADQDTAPAITSHANNDRVDVGSLAVYGTVAHASATPQQLTVQFSIDDEAFATPTSGVYDADNSRWGCSLTVSGEETHVIRMRAWDLTQGGTITVASPVYVNAMPAYVRLTTSGSTFNPTIELHSGQTPTVTWTCEETSEAITGVNPTFNFGSSATRHVRMTVAGNAFGAVRVFNLGFVHTDDAGKESPGSTYNKTAQAVTGVQYTGNLTGLEYWLSANIAGMRGTIDLRGALGLTFIEMYHSGTQGILTNSMALRRICIEGCSISSLDLRSCRLTIRDVRFGVQGYNDNLIGQIVLAFTPIEAGQTYPLAWHWCGNETPLTGLPTGDQLPAIEEAWWWNGRQGARYGTPDTYTFASTALTSLQIHGTDSVRGNRYRWIDIGPTTVLNSVQLDGAGLFGTVDVGGVPTLAVDWLINQVNAVGTSNGTLNLAHCAAPTAASAAARSALAGRGWTITVRTDVGTGVDSDDFEGAGTLASRGWSSLGSETATAQVDVYGVQHALNVTHTMYSMRHWGNPGLSVTHGVNYACEVQIAPEAFTSAAGALWNHGIEIKRGPWGEGIKINFISPTSYFFGKTSRHDDNSFNSLATVLHALPSDWTGGSAIRRLRLSVYGNQCDIYVGSVGGTLTHWITADLTSVAAEVNRDIPDTYYALCGGGSNGETPAAHLYPEIFVEAVTSAPPTND